MTAMLKRIITVCLSLLLLTAIASGQNTLSGTIQSGGLTRDYRLYVPAAYTGAAAVPLVLNLHGYGSNNLEQEVYGSFHAIADTANFLVVMPNGTLDGQGKRFWNTFLGGASVDDVAFLSDLIDTLSATYNIDPNRIYSTGMSNGGFMSYELACALNDRIAAIASVTGSMIQSRLNACNPGRPVPVMEIHGTADGVVPYTGSAMNTFVAIPALVAAWVDFNDCSPTPVITPVPNASTTDGCTAEHYLYTGGDNGSTVEHYKIIGGGHTWPGALFNIGVTNQDFNASKEIWRFFSQFKLDALTATKDADAAGLPAWSLAPNPVSGNYMILRSEGSAKVKKLAIYNSTGMLLQTVVPVVENDGIKIPAGGLENGVYILSVDTGNGVQQIRFVKYDGE